MSALAHQTLDTTDAHLVCMHLLIVKSPTAAEVDREPVRLQRVTQIGDPDFRIFPHHHVQRRVCESQLRSRGNQKLRYIRRRTLIIEWIVVFFKKSTITSTRVSFLLNGHRSGLVKMSFHCFLSSIRVIRDRLHGGSGSNRNYSSVNWLCWKTVISEVHFRLIFVYVHFVMLWMRRN